MIYTRSLTFSLLACIISTLSPAQSAPSEQIETVSYSQLYDFVLFRTLGCPGSFNSATWKIYCASLSSHWEKVLQIAEQDSTLSGMLDRVLNDTIPDQEWNEQTRAALYNIALAFAHNNEIGKAVAVYVALIEIYPNFAQAIHNLNILQTNSSSSPQQRSQRVTLSQYQHQNYWKKIIKVIDRNRQSDDLRLQTEHLNQDDK